MDSYVLLDNVRPLLGLESCLDLELITLNNKVEQIGLTVNEVQEKFTLLNEFHDVLKGLGCVEREYNIKLKANSHLTIQPQRNAPLRLIDKLKETLNDLHRRPKRFISIKINVLLVTCVSVFLSRLEGI